MNRRGRAAPVLADVPRRVCVLRLSALGDCANVVPIIHTLQRARPDIELDWIVDEAAMALLHGLHGVRLHSVNKRAGHRAIAGLKASLRGRRFDVLLNMHASWRANIISRLVDAPRRVGFDTRRARDCQGLFVNERIAPVASAHVVDGFLAFAAHIGAITPVFDWHIPIPAPDRARAAALLGDDARPLLLINPSSSHPRRNWLTERYAALVDYAVRTHGLRVVLIGGPSAAERRVGRAIAAAAAAPVEDLIGRTTLKQLLALFERARVLVTPDSGPAHMANAADIATIGLHAATDARRSGAYRSRALCVDYFAQAAARYRRSHPDALKWGTRIEDDDGVMALIPVAAVKARLDAAVSRATPAIR